MFCKYGKLKYKCEQKIVLKFPESINSIIINVLSSNILIEWLKKLEEYSVSVNPKAFLCPPSEQVI